MPSLVLEEQFYFTGTGSAIYHEDRQSLAIDNNVFFTVHKQGRSSQLCWKKFQSGNVYLGLSLQKGPCTTWAKIQLKLTQKTHFGFKSN